MPSREIYYATMPRTTTDTVAHVARLARLSLTTVECEAFARQLDHILEYAESIQGLDVTSVEPMSHAAATSVFRLDECAPGLSRDKAFEQAPDAADGLYRVPRVIG
jgi:aspartyl-tRNA(Asn)/glutamyl-tRNA(Gln) amidotransferase subunit C